MVVGDTRAWIWTSRLLTASFTSRCSFSAPPPPPLYFLSLVAWVDVDPISFVRLFREPEKLSTLVCPNLYGDIVSYVFPSSFSGSRADSVPTYFVFPSFPPATEQPPS
jgi:hypothetical protein